MDLGLSQLTDDQAISLLQELLQELALRDPFVRNIAQAKIVEESEKLDILKEELNRAVETVREDYRAVIYAEIITDLRKDFKAGRVQIMTAEQEAAEILEAEKKIKARRAGSSFQPPQPGAFNTCSYVGGYPSQSYGGYPPTQPPAAPPRSNPLGPAYPSAYGPRK